MYTEAALLDDPIQLVDPRLAAIVQFSRAPRPKLAGQNSENQGPKPGRERIIKGAVYKDVAREAARHGLLRLRLSKVVANGRAGLSQRDHPAFGYGLLDRRRAPSDGRAAILGCLGLVRGFVHGQMLTDVHIFA